jgi:hypothetical protein
MNGVATEVSQEIGVLLQKQDFDSRPREAQTQQGIPLGSIGTSRLFIFRMILERNDVPDNKRVCMAVAGDRIRRSPVAETFNAGCTDLERMTSHPEVMPRRTARASPNASTSLIA